MGEISDRVVPGVDGTESGLAAVKHGAAEAARSGSELCMRREPTRRSGQSCSAPHLPHRHVRQVPRCSGTCVRDYG